MSAPWAEAGSLVVNTTRLEYRCFGAPPGDAPTLVLLHEGLGCVELWRDFPEKLAKATGFGVFAYSRAGYGHSDPLPLPRPLDYMTREALDVLPKVLDAIQVRSAVLFGHSDGATIAAIHAGEVAGPRVVGLVLLAPHFFTEKAGLTEIAKARDAFNTGDLRQRLSHYHRDPDTAFRGWNDAWLDVEFQSWNVAHVLDKICVPVLAIQGEDDPYGTLDQIDVVVRRVTLASVTRLILAECRHAPHLEQSNAVLEALEDFCKKRMIQLPAYAYLPGINKRHPEDAFDDVKSSVFAGQNIQELEQSAAFQAGLRFLHAGFYWEAHEVLEPVWMELPSKSKEKLFVQALIQLANGRLKLSMERPKAALRLVEKARELMPVDDSETVMSLEVRAVQGWIDELEISANLLI